MSKAFVGKPAPDFCRPAVVDYDFKDVKLSDYKGKWLILFFYPMDFTFVCPTEIIAFSKKAEEFRKINCEVVAASCDSQYSHFAWISTPRKEGGLGEMNIPILADKDLSMARDYGVLIEDAGISLRGMFIIDPKGILRQITINDLPVGRNVEEAMRLVKAFQFVEEHGEVCPANWHEGESAMKASNEGMKEYVSKL